ncbi:MAG: hypothetical protein AAGG75_05900 [Bacteroidota bacterium]
MKKFFKILGILIATILILIGFLWLYAHEPEPTGKVSPEADRMAEAMMAAVNKPAWDTTHYVHWTFAGRETFLWDRQRNYIDVKWQNKRVLLDINTLSGIAWQEDQKMEGEAAEQLIQKAWAHFCNDSFWLNAVVKADDSGTQRSIVQLDDGREGLKVDYSQGGVTPGDAYVWILDKNKRPVAWKMWVKIIPVGGLEFSWSDWTTLSTGAQIATSHIGPMGVNIAITDLKAGSSWKDMGLSTDPFSALEQKH